LGTSADSTRAAQVLAEMGAGCIITLGGDGTNRAIAKGCGTVPLIPISTGTNNVFPAFLEGTIAGMAAGLLASGRAGHKAVRRVPWLEVHVNGVATDNALVDVAASSLPFVGSRAIWDLSTVREVVLARVKPATIGLSALGGALLNSSPETDGEPGMHIVLGQGAMQILAPLAPGLVTWVGIRSYSRLAMDSVVRFQSRTGTIALDGEREIELGRGTLPGGLADQPGGLVMINHAPTAAVVEVKLRADGPFVVNVPAVFEVAARNGHLHREEAELGNQLLS